MSVEPEIHLRETSANDVPRVKPAPKAEGITVPFSYTSSDDGTDENLLIVLHGLGKCAQIAGVAYTEEVLQA